MVEKPEVIEQLNQLTDRLSTQVRTVALAVLALTWGLLIGESDVALSVTQSLKTHLLAIGAMAIVVMFMDFLQYVCGHRNTSRLLSKMEEKDLKETEYDYEALSYKCRRWLFLSKQWVLAFTVIWLLIVLGKWLLTAG